MLIAYSLIVLFRLEFLHWVMLIIVQNSFGLWFGLGFLHWFIPEHRPNLWCLLSLQEFITAPGFVQRLSELIIYLHNLEFRHWLEFIIPRLRFWYWHCPWCICWFHFLFMLVNFILISVPTIMGIEKVSLDIIFSYWFNEVEPNLRFLIISWFMFEVLILLIHSCLIKVKVGYIFRTIVEAAIWLGLGYIYGFRFWCGFIFGLMLGPFFIKPIMW